MSGWIHKILIFGNFGQTVEKLIFVDRIQYNSAYDKARIYHESSLKISVSEFSDGLTSFQDFMIFMAVKVLLPMSTM